MARHLGPARFGVLSIGFLVARWGALIADWGAAQRGSRDVAADDGAAVALLSRTRVAAVTVTAPIFVIGALAIGRPELLPLVMVIVAGGLTRDWIALGQGRAAAAALPSVARAIPLVVGAAVLSTTWMLALAIGSAYLVSVLLSVAMNRHTNHPRNMERVITTRTRLRVTPPWALVIVLAAQVYTTLDSILLAVMRSNAEAGTYNALYRIPLAITTVAGLAITGLVPPLTADLRTGQISLAEARRTLLRIGAAAGAAVAVATPLLVLVGPLAFGPDYLRGRSALALILAATALAVAGAPLGALGLALGEERRLSIIVVIGAITNVAGNALLIPAFGMNGAGLTTVISEAFVLIAVWRLLVHYSANGAIALAQQSGVDGAR